MPQLLSLSEYRLIFQGFFSDFFSRVPRLCLYSALRRDHCRCKKQLNHHQLTLLLSKCFLILFPGMELFPLFYGGKLETLESLNTAQGHPEGTQNVQHSRTPVLGLKNSLGWRRKNSLGWRRKWGSSRGERHQPWAGSSIPRRHPIPTGTSKTEPAIILLAHIPSLGWSPTFLWKWSLV